MKTKLILLLITLLFISGSVLASDTTGYHQLKVEHAEMQIEIVKLNKSLKNKKTYEYAIQRLIDDEVIYTIEGNVIIKFAELTSRAGCQVGNDIYEKFSIILDPKDIYIKLFGNGWAQLLDFDGFKIISIKK